MISISRRGYCGRWHGPQYRLVEQCFRLDLARLRPTSNEEVAVLAKGCSARLQFDLSQRQAWVSGAPVRLLWTGQPFGGGRWWFRCPRCGARRRVLYCEPRRNTLGCRGCLALRYQSQRLDRYWRLNRRLDRLWQRMGGAEDSRRDAWPERPRGMRWRTFERLRDDYCELNDQIWAIGLAEIRSLAKWT